MRKAIKMIKYRRVIDISGELGTACTGVVGEFCDTFIPLTSFIKHFRPQGTSIPLHESRQRSRWFNQSEILGKRIASIWNMPFDKDILKRISFSKPQAGLSKIDRIQNIKDSFRINTTIKNNAYIVFDDVWTTGATMREVVRVLKHGGVRNVWCVTLAR
jgi:ComF family protein